MFREDLQERGRHLGLISIYIHTRHLKAVGLNEVTMGVSVEKAKRRLGDQGLWHLEVRDIRKKQQSRLRRNS